MDTISVIIFLATLFVILGFIIFAFGVKFFEATDVEKRINSFVIEPHEDLKSRSLNDLQSRGITGTLLQRTIISWLNTVVTFLGRFTPENTIQETQRRLTIAGNPYNLRVPQYYGFRILFIIIGALFSVSIFQSNPSLSYLLAVLLILLFFVIAPEIWLNSMMKKRQNSIRKGLPDALDMLSVCVSAGLSFDQALVRVGQTFKTPIGMEFSRAVSEIEVGISRKQALRNLQSRVDIPELSSFVAVILQAEALGMSIAEVLHTQAEQMRVYRQYLAREIAQLLPAKMMVPLALFIFPALWAVILGPTLPLLLEILK